MSRNTWFRSPSNSDTSLGLSMRWLRTRRMRHHSSPCLQTKQNVTWRDIAFQWRNNERDGVSNHLPRDCLLNRLFRRRSKKTSKLRVTGLCPGNSSLTGGFPAQRASNAETASIWWRHHAVAGPIYWYIRWTELPWIFPGAPLIFNGAPRNIQGNIESYGGLNLVNFVPADPQTPNGTGLSAGSELTPARVVFSLVINVSWWRHQMETFSALLAICVGNSPVTGEFPAQRPVTRSFDVFFDLRLNKRLSKQWWSWWFETPSHPFWRHCYVRIAFNRQDYDIQNGRRELARLISPHFSCYAKKFHVMHTYAVRMP